MSYKITRLKRSQMHEYQNEGVDFINANRGAALFLEMGLGKTVTSLTAFKELRDIHMEVNNALVIAPKRVVENVWAEECEKWEHLNDLKVVKIIGTEAQRRRALAEPGDIYLIGRDSVPWLCDIYGGLKLPFDMLIIDELSSFKNHNSNRFKALRKVRPRFRRVIGLTGTPAPNGLIDLWAQMFLIDQGQRLGKFITHYRETYFKEGKRNGEIVYNYKVQSDGERRIYEAIKDITMSMKAKDYLTLPGRIVNDINLYLGKKLQNQYDDFEREQVMQLLESTDENGEIAALNAAALSNKLLQFANGAIYDSNKVGHDLHRIKLDALKEILDDANGKPVLVAWTYRTDAVRIHQYLKAYNPVALAGKDTVDAWNRGEIQLMTMHPASGGHGINMQAGGHIIVWFGQTWSLELEQQFNARLDRQGQKNLVIINRLIMRNTMDEDVIRALDTKTAGQDSLMAAVKARINKYS